MIRSSRSGTLLGIVSILIWSTNIAVSRSLTEDLGPVTAGLLLYLVGGILATVWTAAVHRGWTWLRTIPVRYLAVCGGLFVVYEVCLYLCLGLAADRQQVLVAGLVNYLWVPLTMVFSLRILKKKAGPLLIPGMVCAFGGVILASAGSSGTGGFSLRQAAAGGAAAYGLALVCAVTWALYSNFCRHLARDGQANAVPLFILATGISLIPVRLLIREEAVWSTRTGFEFIYTVLLPVVIAYMLWDRAMRTGNMTLVASLAYFIPLISTVIGSLYLGVPMGAALWGGCILVIAGAGICRISVKDS